MRFKHLIMLLILAGTAWGAAAQVPSVAEITRQGVPVTPAKYPDADSVLLYDREQAVYQPDGTGNTRDEFFQKVLTEKGRRDLREISLYFHSIYEAVSMPLLEVIRPDGTTRRIEVDKTAKVMVNPGQMAENIFDPNQKIMKVAVPGLAIGDILHVVTERRIVKARIPDVWCDIFVLQADIPILRYEVEIDAPATRPLKTWQVKDSVNGTVQASETPRGDRIIYRWVAENVPQLIPEPGMPPLYTCAQRLLVSTVPDWQGISSWYYRLCRPRLDAVSPEMRRKVKELTTNATTPQEKIRRIFQFVSQNIRYMGITPEKEAPGYEPHDVAMTFANRYGVCRDKAALLASMLELAGIQAFPTLFYVGPVKDQEVPNNYFNHAIVAAEVVPGEYILMDPTYETTTELLPSGLAEKSYLVAKPKGDTLRTSAAVPADGNMLSIQTRAKVLPDGKMSVKAELRFMGVNDQAYRDAFSRWPVELRRQFFAARLKSAVPGAELENFAVQPENIRDMNSPLEVTLHFTAPSGIRPDGEVFALQLPSLATVFGVANQMLDETALEKRQFPLMLYSTCGVEEKLTLELPKDLKKVALPRAVLGVESAAMRITRKLQLQDQLLECTSTLSIDRTRIPPVAYLELKEALRVAERELRAYPLFAVGDPAAAWPLVDAVYQEWDDLVTLLSPNQWQTRRTVALKVLNYAGVKACSELRIGYNPIWEDVRVENAAVVGADGQTHPLTAKEMNLMDAPWVASAPRYPAEKILVVNFPGVKPGSVIRYTVVRECRNRIAPDFTPLFADRLPVLRRRFTLENRGKVELQPIPDVPQVTLSGTSWSRSFAPPLPVEPGAAAPEKFAPAFRVTAGTLADYAATLRAALDECVAGQQAAAAKAQELVKGVSGEAAKLRLIRDFVAREIRSAGPSFTGLPLALLTHADRTLSDRYGHDADRAILLKAMLDALGFKTWFVVRSDLSDTPENRRLAVTSPSPSAFDGIEVAVLAPDGGRPYYLGSPDQYADLDAAAGEGKLALNLSDGKVFVLEPRSATADQVTDFTVTLQNDGSAVIRVESRYSGRLFGREKRRYAELTPEELRRHGEALAAMLAQAAKLNGKVTTDFARSPGLVSYEVTVPDFAPKTGDYRQLELPWFDLLAMAVPTAATRRDTPFERRDARLLQLRWTVNFPAAWEVAALPGSRMVANALEEFRLTSLRQSGKVTVRAELRLRPGMLAPGFYPELVRLQTELSALPLRSVIFRMTDQ